MGRVFPYPGERFPLCSSQCFANWVYATLAAEFPWKSYCVACESPQPVSAKYCIRCGAKGILSEKDYKQYVGTNQALKEYQGARLTPGEYDSMVELERAMGKPIPLLLNMLNETFGFISAYWHVTGLALCDIGLHLVPESIWALPQLKQLVFKRDQLSSAPPEQRDTVKLRIADLERRKCTITRLL